MASHCPSRLLRLAAAALAGALALGAAGCDRPAPAEQVGGDAGRAIADVERAVRAASGVDGVRTVENRLVVARGS